MFSFCRTGAGPSVSLPTRFGSDPPAGAMATTGGASSAETWVFLTAAVGPFFTISAGVAALDTVTSFSSSAEAAFAGLALVFPLLSEFFADVFSDVSAFSEALADVSCFAGCSETEPVFSDEASNVAVEVFALDAAGVLAADGAAGWIGATAADVD